MGGVWRRAGGGREREAAMAVAGSNLMRLTPSIAGAGRVSIWWYLLSQRRGAHVVVRRGAGESIDTYVVVGVRVSLVDTDGTRRGADRSIDLRDGGGEGLVMVGREPKYDTLGQRGCTSEVEANRQT
uniref:DUF834 domain-containing protein n=1 Tax=Oryza rufipogon TaxID=4529 RepID=A0A0E0NR16_ORYRU